MLQAIAFVLVTSLSIACVDVEQPDDVALDEADELDVTECPEVTDQEPYVNIWQDAPPAKE